MKNKLNEGGNMYKTERHCDELGEGCGQREEAISMVAEVNLDMRLLRRSSSQ